MAWIDQKNLPEGYWGSITSSLVWCEEKYYWSKYIAEPVNTLTNFYIIALSVLGAIHTIRHNMPLRFVLCYLGGATIGIGSFAFHATLKYEAQMLDELPMIYTMAIYLYCVTETSPGYSKSKYGLALPVGLTALVAFVTVTYVYYNNPVFHQISYAIMQVWGTIQVVSLLNSKEAKLTKQQRSEISHQLFVGSAIFVTAFGIWNIDNIYCGSLRGLRQKIGYPTALLLEGHGWWHLGTGLGAYMVIAASQRLVMSVKEGSADNFAFSYKLGFHPFVQRLKPYKQNGTSVTNGKNQKVQ